jgi:hypothetical protein
MASHGLSSFPISFSSSVFENKRKFFVPRKYTEERKRNKPEDFWGVHIRLVKTY